MNIMYLNADTGIPILGHKGASIHVRAIAQAMKQLGHRVVIAGPSLTSHPWESPVECDVPVLHIPASDEAKAAVLQMREFCDDVEFGSHSLPGELRKILYNQQIKRQLSRKFRKTPPDVIYERVSLFGTAGRQLADEFDCPLLVELNAPLSREQELYRSSTLTELAATCEQLVLRRADAVFVVSAELAKYVQSCGVDPRQIHVLPNGVDSEHFSSKHECGNGQHTQRRCPDELILGFVGGLRPWHGVERLPSLMASLARDYPRLRLLVVGDGPLRDPLHRQFDKLGVLDRVTLTGPVDHENVPAFVRRMDIALAPYPSLSHEFYFSPLKIFEYMSSGVPVVASRVGQIPQIVTHGETGLLYEADHDGELEIACRKLIDDASLRYSMGTRAALVARERFTWRQNAAHILDVARSLACDAPEAVPC